MKTLQHLLTISLFAAATTSFAQTTTVTITTDSTGQSTTTTTTTQTTTTINPAGTSEGRFDRVTSGLKFYIGLNNFSNSLPDAYNLRPIGSRFFAIAWQKRIPIVMGNKAKLRLITGPEVAWNNFMFEDRNMLTIQNKQLVMEQATTDLHRSKLVTTQLNLPLMLNLSLRSGFSLSVGAYAGMRLDSYTKVKPVGGTTVRDHNAYNLNPLRWGLTTELGYRGSSKLFFRYEPDSPFRTSEGPNASVWAVGIKL